MSLRSRLLRLAADLRAVQNAANPIAAEMMSTYMAEGITLVAWLQSLDPTFPDSRDQYRDHPLYLAATFCRRIQHDQMYRDAVHRQDRITLRWLIKDMQQQLKEMK